MIEAMACGTSVNRESLPEVVEHGTSGFVVDGEAKTLAMLSRIGWSRSPSSSAGLRAPGHNSISALTEKVRSYLSLGRQPRSPAGHILYAIGPVSPTVSVKWTQSPTPNFSKSPSVRLLR
jgi:hypothetical protein